MEWRSAKVIDNVDELKKGRIKVQILPEFGEMTDTTNFPWVYPYIKDNHSHYVPEINEFVKVVIRDKFWQQIEYITGDYVRGLYPYEDFQNIVSNMSELGTQTYPQPIFVKKFADGSFIFHNSSTGETGIYNKNGSYFLIDSNGSVLNKVGAAQLKINKTNNKFTMKNSIDMKTDIITVILDSLTYILTGGLVNGSGPCLPTDATQPVKITTAKTNLSVLMES